MKAYIFSNTLKSASANVEKDVKKKLNSLSIEQTDSLSECDIVITIGGDGTILKAGKDAAKAKKPLLGINTGRLGFMATLEQDGLDKLEHLKNKEYFISRRMMLNIEVNGKTESALNEVVLHRGTSSRLPDFSVMKVKGDSELNGNTEIIRVRADGIIISTPTGSTAYSLSAGGPIIEPEIECFLLTALSPHTLFNRPMVFSPNTPLSVTANDVYVSVDGNDEVMALKGSCVTVTKSNDYLDLIDIDGYNFYNSIHNKLITPLKSV